MHNKEAILINPLDVDALKAIKMLYHNQLLRTNLALRAKDRSKYYDIDLVYAQINQIYKN